MTEESLVSLVGESGPQPVEHRPAKAYFSPELKVYGKAVDLTASGTGPSVEFVSEVDGTGCEINPNASSCRL